MRLPIGATLALISSVPAAPETEPSWVGKGVVLTRPGVELQAPTGEQIAPKTAGVAKDLTFQVVKDEGDRLRVASRRQAGWISRADAVPFDQAVAYFTDRLTREPKDSHGLTARGVVLMGTGRPDQALADFDRAIQLDPKAVVAYYHRANLAYGRKQYDRALGDYNAVIRLDPAFDWSYHVRGWIYYRKKDYDRALADYETAIRLAPTETVFYRDRGNIELARKQYDKALADYSKSIELDPSYAVPWLQRGRTRLAQKEYARALRDLEKAVALQTKVNTYPLFYTTLAMFRAGCPDDRFRDGKKALALARQAHRLAQGPDELAALAAAHAELAQLPQLRG